MKYTLSLLTLLLGISLCAQDQVLFPVTENLKVNELKTIDTKLELVDKDGTKKILATTGVKSPWPGLTLPAPDGKWDVTANKYIETEIENLGDHWLRVAVRVDNPGKGPSSRISGGAFVPPKSKKILRVELTRCRKDAPKLFAMRSYPQGMWAENRIRPDDVVQVVVFVHRPIREEKFLVGDIRATGVYKKATYEDMTSQQFFPFVDQFGQFIHKNWPGKTQSLDDMMMKKEEEEKELAKYPGCTEWTKYGGWANGPALEAKGHFYTAKHGGKWWLVDPEGKLFFSHGITCVRAGGSTPITDRDEWFEKLPPNEGQAKQFYFTQKHVNNGYYKNKSPLCFDFGKNNLRLKYGENWEKDFAELSHRRLRSWGMNTLGLWSINSIYEMQKTPYVTWVHYWPKTLKGKSRHWKKFVDVFDPATWQSLEQRAKMFLAKSADDPWCIGVFVDNELSWEEETTIAETTIISPPAQKAKQVFVADLKAKYQTIDALNKVWKSSFESWEALLANKEKINVKRAHDDLLAFNQKTTETYFKSVHDILEKVAPKKLYLGCRFNGDFIHAAKIATKYCDVVSYNLYRRSVSDFEVAGGMDKPAIIGEWHFGADDRGLFRGGLREVSSQAKRAKVYQEYVTGALKNKAFVGCHWFQYNDEMVSGRPLEGENYQIGFVDVADTPYRETIDAARKIGYSMYHVRSGE